MTPIKLPLSSNRWKSSDEIVLDRNKVVDERNYGANKLKINGTLTESLSRTEILQSEN